MGISPTKVTKKWTREKSASARDDWVYCYHQRYRKIENWKKMAGSRCRPKPRSRSRSRSRSRARSPARNPCYIRQRRTQTPPAEIIRLSGMCICAALPGFLNWAPASIWCIVNILFECFNRFTKIERYQCLFFWITSLDRVHEKYPWILTWSRNLKNKRSLNADITMVCLWPLQ